jgi:hypothetical protein
MRGKKFQKNPSSVCRDTADKFCVLQVKCPQLLTDRNQTCELRSACVENVRYRFSRKSFQWKPRYSQKGTLFSEQSGLKYRPKATNLRRFGLHAWKVGQLQEIPPIEAEIKNEKVLLLFK